MNRDGWKILASLVAGPMLLIVGIAVMLTLAYCAGQRTGKQSLQVAALRDTIRVTDSVVRVQTETLTVYRTRTVAAKASSDSAKRISDSLDARVIISDDSTLLFRDAGHVIVSPSDSAVPVPYVVVADIQALRRTVAQQDTTIHWLTVENRSLWARDTVRMKQLDYLDRLIHELKPPKCGRRCGFVLGAASVAGLVYLVK